MSIINTNKRIIKDVKVGDNPIYKTPIPIMLKQKRPHQYFIHHSYKPTPAIPPYKELTKIPILFTHIIPKNPPNK